MLDEWEEYGPMGQRWTSILRALGAWGGLCAGLVALALFNAGAALAIEAQVSAKSETGFGRMIISMPEVVEYEETLENGVLVLTFAEPVDIDLSNIVKQMPGFVIAARSDPDRFAMRFALARQLTVNTIAAGEKIFVDFLSPTWTGPLPGLPREVLADLVARAREAARLKKLEAAANAPKEPELKIRVGRQPTFSRVVFEWQEVPRTRLSRDGDKVVVSFNQPAKPNLVPLNVDPPANILGAKATVGVNKLDIEIQVAEGVDVRGFREGKTYVLDVLGSPVGPVEPLDEATLGEQVLPNLPNQPRGTEKIVISGRETAQPGGTPPLIDVAMMPLVVPKGSSKSPKPMVGTAPEPANDRAMPAKQAMASPAAPVARPAASDPDAVKPAGEPTGQSSARTAMAASTGAMDEPDSTGQLLAGNATVKASAKLIGTTLRLTFPFKKPVAAAVFQRGNFLWLVFDTGAPIDLSGIKPASKGHIGKYSVVNSDTMQLVRLPLIGRYLSTAAPAGNKWVVSIGDQVLDPTIPVSLTRALRTDGRAKVTVDFPGSGQVHWIADSDIGDQIAVVTVFPPARGLIKRQEFVEFAVLPTALGLAIKPYADDLAVRLNFSEVVITRDAGLTISAGRWPVYVPGAKAVSDGTRPGFIDFENWRQGGPRQLRFHVRRLEQAMALQKPAEKEGARLELARLFIANELGAEALGVMRLARQEDAEVAKDPVFLAMRGVARLMMGQIDGAQTDFAARGLENDPHSALWRGLIAVEKRQWRVAQLAFEDGREALETYPLKQQMRFRLAGARAALETRDLPTASIQIEALGGAKLDGPRAAEVILLQAWLAASLGNAKRAEGLFLKAEASDYFPVVAEARLRRFEFEFQNQTIDPAKAIDQLERLAMTWRGDEVELNTQRLLSKLYIGQKNYRSALEIMRTAVKVHGESELTRLIAEDMRQLFEGLYLQGGADAFKPLKALGLYYDFRGLTPIGRRGDEMIRKLAARLVAVDLLDQASDLLDYQVSKRLIGAARAQVAGDLALIYLMARKPDLALRALRKSRQAVLPKAMKRRRAMLEARALAELGRVERAVELLSTLTGEDVEKSKADALWQGKKWQSAGEQIERMLGAKWQGRDELADADRFNVMRAAISLALADDKLGLQRLRRKFVGKMAESPDAIAFDVVTSPGVSQGVAFRNLANDIAEIDTLSAFLKDFRARDKMTGQGQPLTDAGAAIAAVPPA